MKSTWQGKNFRTKAARQGKTSRFDFSMSTKNQRNFKGEKMGNKYCFHTNTQPPISFQRCVPRLSLTIITSMNTFNHSTENSSPHTHVFLAERQENLSDLSLPVSESPSICI